MYNWSPNPGKSGGNSAWKAGNTDYNGRLYPFYFMVSGTIQPGAQHLMFPGIGGILWPSSIPGITGYLDKVFINGLGSGGLDDHGDRISMFNAGSAYDRGVSADSLRCLTQ